MTTLAPRAGRKLGRCPNGTQSERFGVDCTAQGTTLNPVAALKLGWPIIPCGIGKKPLLKTWKPYQTRRPTEEEKASWVRTNPPTWAMITGAPSGRTTLDFDGESGLGILRGLNLDPHRCTPSGGFHVDLRHPGWRVKTLNSKTDRKLQKRYPGLDIRADGGYACVAGHTEHGEYLWLRDPEPYPLDILPTDMREFFGLLHPPSAKPSQPTRGKSHAMSANGRVDTERLIIMALDRVGFDGRNNSGMWMACQFRDNGYSRAEAEAAMRNYRGRCPGVNAKGAREEYTEGEMLATLREAYSRPARQPWESRKARMSGSTNSQAAKRALPVLEPAKALNPRPAPLVPVLGIEDLLTLDVPEPQMLIEHIQVERGTQLSVGAPKSGKTIIAVAKALAVATGKPLFGHYRVLRQGPAMIIEQDDPAGAGSIKTIVQKAGIKCDVPLYVVPRVPFNFGIAFEEWLEKEIRDKFLRFVVLDSYTALRGPRTAGIDIVKAEQADLTMLDALGKRTGCGIEVIHHSSKGSASLDWSQEAAGTFAMGAATEGQMHISRFRELDGAAPERLARIRLRHGADIEMLLRFRAETLDFEHVMEGGAAPHYPLLLQLKTTFDERTFSPKDVTHATGVSRATAHRMIDQLYRVRALEKRGYGEYALVKVK